MQDILYELRPCTPHELSTAKTKPAKCSDVRWRIELRRRAIKKADGNCHSFFPDPDRLR